MIRFIGIDPGDVWCGYAMLEYDPQNKGDRYFLTEARTFHVPSRQSLLEVTHDVMFALPSVVIAENYQVRPVGYNRFNKGGTLRLLGALELATGQSLASSWNMVPPASWEKELPKLVPTMFKTWTTDWPLLPKRRKDWGHAMSAWRVLLRYMMQHHPTVLEALRDAQCIASYKRVRSPLYASDRRTSVHDLAAPTAKWFLPRSYYRPLSYLITSGRHDL